jgi:hypothetical protein
VIQAPFPPTQRSVSAGLLVAASIAAGLLISGLVVLILATLRETFLSPEQAERALELPVLNAPVALGGGGARRGSGSSGQRALHMAYGRMIAAIDASTNAPSKIAMALSFSKDDGLLQVIRGVAIELEHRSSKPVLVLDMASAPDAPLYGQPNAQGLLTWTGSGAANNAGSSAGNSTSAHSELATQRADDLVFEAVERHNIVVARPKSGMLPSSWQHTAALFDALRESHDYVIVHAPPASESFTGIENAPLADATVLAVRAEVSRKPILLDLKTQVQDAGARLIGIAMTHRRGYIPQIIYRFF